MKRTAGPGADRVGNQQVRNTPSSTNRKRIWRAGSWHERQSGPSQQFARRVQLWRLARWRWVPVAVAVAEGAGR